MRRLFPKRLKIWFRLLLRRWADCQRGIAAQFASQPKGDLPAFAYSLSLQQPIRQSSHYENKIHNIQKGIDAIAQVVLMPNQILSFWKIIGEPSGNRGFRLGRNILGGQLSEDYGGGLCQLSSIIYHTALLAELAVIERHHHSVDIYTEEERFTPLGADATVVFAYKDLRIKNNHNFPVRFVFNIIDNNLHCHLQSSRALAAVPLVFERSDSPKQRTIITKDKDKILAISHYKI